MQKLINLGYGLEWNSCHEWGFMSIRFFLCPEALWRLLFENVHMKLSKRMGKRPAWPPVILNVREGNARQGEIESGPTDPKGPWEQIPWERPEQWILWVANGYWLPYADGINFEQWAGFPRGCCMDLGKHRACWQNSLTGYRRGGIDYVAHVSWLSREFWHDFLW